MLIRLGPVPRANDIEEIGEEEDKVVGGDSSKRHASVIEPY